MIDRYASWETVMPGFVSECWHEQSDATTGLRTASRRAREFPCSTGVATPALRKRRRRGHVK